MRKTLEYKCPDCGSSLRYDPGRQLVVCDSCDYNISPMDYETEKKSGRLSRTGAVEKSTKEEKEKVGKQEAFDWSKYVNTDDMAKLDPTVVFTCSSCGAQLETDEVTMATHCPYCDNNVLVQERAEGSLRPNYIIPFRITPDQVPKVVRKFYHKKRFLPRDFLTKSRLDGIQGVYVPFWLFSAQMDAEAVISGTKVRTFSEGNYDVTETEYYDLYRRGSIGFSNIPVDASVKMNNDLMDSLEPYDYSKMVEFNPSYMSGYLADRFDSGPEVEIARADSRMRTTALSHFMSTCRGYSTSDEYLNGVLTSAEVRYVMFPVYLVNVRFGEKKIQYAINGQTGKIAGKLPLDSRRKRAWFWKTTGIVSGALYCLMLLAQLL